MDRQDLQKKYGGGKNSYLCWPVTLAGFSHEFHLTCKFLGGTQYEVEDIIDLLSDQDTTGPSNDSITWLPHTFDTKNDGKVKVLLIEGLPDHMKACHDALGILRTDDYPEWKAHVTVDEEIWDEVKDHGATPRDLEIAFGPLQLRRGEEILHEWKQNDSV